jgi:hypothetical protein
VARRGVIRLKGALLILSDVRRGSSHLISGILQENTQLFI